MKSKRLLAAFCVSAMLVSFAGCNTKKENVTSSTDDVTSTPTENFREESSSRIEESQASSGISANTIEDLSDLISKDVEDAISELNAKYGKLKSEINTYAKYLKSSDKMEEFYDEVVDTNKSLCIKMSECSLKYAELILNSGKDGDEMYDDLEEIYDNIYDDAGDDIYDGIYDGLLEEMYDDYYDGLLDDAHKNKEYSEYSEWLEARSDEYEWWSDARSDAYSDWADTRSDIYDFYSDIRSAVYGEDFEKAQKKLDKFRKDVDKLKGVTPQTETSNTFGESSAVVSSSGQSQSGASVPEASSGESSSEKLVNGMRPSFKEALDSYEEFFDKYCTFMKKYIQNPTDLTLLADYTKYMSQYAETVEKMDELDDSEMNDAEAKYYLEVTTRINQKLIGVAN